MAINYWPAGRRSIERSDFLRGAILENSEIFLREAADLRSIGSGDRASDLHKGDARMDGSFSRNAPCKGGGIFR